LRSETEVADFADRDYPRDVLRRLLALAVLSVPLVVLAHLFGHADGHGLRRAQGQRHAPSRP